MSAVMRNDPEFLKAIDELLDEYAAVVSKSELGHGSKAIYTDMATCFVRWVHGAFQPGSVGAWKRLKIRAKRVPQLTGDAASFDEKELEVPAGSSPRSPRQFSRKNQK
jgi:hypothetical protein